MPLEWTSEYSVWTANVGRVGQLVVAWSQSQTTPGFAVSAFGVRLKEYSQDVEDGQRRAVILAKRLLADATASLD